MPPACFGRTCASLLAQSGDVEDAFALFVVDDHKDAWRIALDDRRSWSMEQVDAAAVPSPGVDRVIDLSIGDTGIPGDTPSHPRGRRLQSFESRHAELGPAGTLAFEDGTSMTVQLVHGHVTLRWEWASGDGGADGPERDSR